MAQKFLERPSPRLSSVMQVQRAPSNHLAQSQPTPSRHRQSKYQQTGISLIQKRHRYNQQRVKHRSKKEKRRARHPAVTVVEESEDTEVNKRETRVLDPDGRQKALLHEDALLVHSRNKIHGTASAHRSGLESQSAPEHPIPEAGHDGVLRMKVEGGGYFVSENGLGIPERKQFQKYDVKPIESLTFDDVRSYTRDQLRSYDMIYDLPRNRRKAEMQQDLAEAVSWWNYKNPQQYNIQNYYNNTPKLEDTLSHTHDARENGEPSRIKATSDNQMKHHAGSSISNANNNVVGEVRQSAGFIGARTKSNKYSNLINKDNSIDGEYIKQLVNKVVDEVIRDAAYSHHATNTWTNKIVESLVKALVTIDKDNKYIVTCIIVQNLHQGMRSTTSCFWNPQTDTGYSLTNERKGMYVITTIFMCKAAVREATPDLSPAEQAAELVAEASASSL